MLDELTLNVQAASEFWQCKNVVGEVSNCAITSTYGVVENICAACEKNAAEVGLALITFKKEYDEAVRDALHVDEIHTLGDHCV